ncbi:MAG: pyridoxal-dependent decarboxylase, partial [Actinomycetota bacterium]|nr:pyridoxal-dependent decarboxylase [Actinomycetota bacterium]
MGLYPYVDRYPVERSLPQSGRGRAEILAEIRAMSAVEDAVADDGKISGSIYSGDHEHYAFLNEVFGYYSHANVLQRDVYPSATRFEGEIIAMTAGLMHAPEPCGVVTSGGTESLMNSLLVYREWGRERGITNPNVVLPVTAHPALDKGAHYFGIDLRKATVTDRFVADMGSVGSLVDNNTVALVGSAGTYPHGLIDPIDRMSSLAVECGINLHVDGCLGGFILCWGESLGLAVPMFDFRLPGVTSISADTHKYGFALKGSSVLLYRTPELRRHQYFMAPDWPGGLYTSPGMSGSRSGGIIPAAWAAMVSLGRDGYMRIAADIFRTATELRSIVGCHPELEVIGDPFFNVAFRAASAGEVDIFHVNDYLAQHSWRMNGLQNPPAIHFCITRPNTAPSVMDRFAEDLHG